MEDYKPATARYVTLRSELPPPDTTALITFLNFDFWSAVFELAAFGKL